jgi:hypothetical protein
MIASSRNFQARIASGTNVVLGIWLIASPWVFGYSGRAPVLNSVLVGMLIAMLATLRLAAMHQSAGLSAMNLLLGFWTIVSPWASGYAIKSGRSKRSHGRGARDCARDLEHACYRD